MSEKQTNTDDKMDVAQYRSLVDLLNSNSEDQHRAMKALKQEFGDKLDINLKYIGFEIKDMKEVLQTHNSRLRKSEEREIRLEERSRINEDLLKAQKEVCAKQRMTTRRLKTVDSWLEWIVNHLWKTIGIIIAAFGILLTISNAIYHLINLNIIGG